MTKGAGASEWLVIIDPQRIFADPTSDWGSPLWPDALPNIQRLARAYAGRTIITRWVPPSSGQRGGSWDAYMKAWPFADRPADDPYLDIVDALASLKAEVVSAPTFGKWDALARILGPAPQFVLTGVATDCCVISTALPAADAGATIRVASDACAGSSPENQAAALQVMGLYPPQITVASTDEIL